MYLIRCCAKEMPTSCSSHNQKTIFFAVLFISSVFQIVIKSTLQSEKTRRRNQTTGNGAKTDNSFVLKILICSDILQK